MSLTNAVDYGEIARRIASADAIMVASAPRATYVTVNRGELFIPTHIAQKSFGIDAPIDEALSRLRKELAC